MKAITRSLMFAGLLGAAGFAQAAGNCTVAIKGDDAMKFDVKEATVSASCPTITVEPDRSEPASTFATAQVACNTTARFMASGPPRTGPRSPAVPNANGRANRADSSAREHRASSAAVGS